MNMWQFAATFFYLGKLPFAPGSWGSLGALILWIFLPSSYILQMIMIILLFSIGVISSKKMAAAMNDYDPSEVVIDEAVGMWIALFMLPHSIAIYSMAFILFRIFDIFKPSYIYRVQNLPGGWGIMMDDVLAGIIAWLICQGLLTIL
jgi:phosphatidylglycerophosphatase A